MMAWYWLVLEVLAGFGLGLLYFAYLWRTTRQLCADQNAGTWLPQALFRSALLIGLFYLLAGSHWSAWIACLLGWVAARQVMVNQIREAP